MPNFERANRYGTAGSQLWKLDLGLVDRRRAALKRHLILEPYEAGNVTQLNAWIEEQRIRYVWETGSIDEKPKGPPSYHVQEFKLDNTYLHGCAGIPGVGFTLIRALARGELTEFTALEAIHGLFWAAFVDNDQGLTYLHRHASEEIGGHYVRNRLSWCLRRELGKRSGGLDGDIKNPVAKLIDDATNEPDPMLGLRAWQRACVDDAFYDALEVIALTNDPVEIRNKQALQFLRLHRSKKTRDPSSE